MTPLEPRGDGYYGIELWPSDNRVLLFVFSVDAAYFPVKAFTLVDGELTTPR